MGIFRDISIEFGGVDYVVTPTVRLLRMIEMKGRRDFGSFNLVEVMVRLAGGSGFPDGAFVLSELIKSAGGKVTDDEAFAKLQSFKTPQELTQYIGLICSCIMPEVAEKKTEAGAAAKT